VKNAARIEAETREPESKPEPDPLPVPGAEAARQAPATDTVPTAPTETSDDETEPDEEEDLEPTPDDRCPIRVPGLGSPRADRRDRKTSHNLRLYALRTFRRIRDCSPYRGTVRLRQIVHNLR
jgi:hypothetical protein